MTIHISGATVEKPTPEGCPCREWANPRTCPVCNWDGTEPHDPGTFECECERDIELIWGHWVTCNTCGESRAPKSEECMEEQIKEEN